MMVDVRFMTDDNLDHIIYAADTDLVRKLATHIQKLQEIIRLNNAAIHRLKNKVKHLGSDLNKCQQVAGHWRRLAEEWGKTGNGQT